MERDGIQFNRRENDLSIRLLQAGDVIYSRIYHRVTVRQPCKLPKHGPAILMCNHISGLDPLMIQAVSSRLIRWMMAKEYYQIKALNWVYSTIGVIPVERRGRDMAATRAAMRALADGYILGVFPEGRIETGDELLPFQPGIALIAIKTGVPVYPAYIDGTQRRKEMDEAFMYPQQATLRFGPPVEFDRSSTSRENLDLATSTIQAAVETLRLAQRESAPTFSARLMPG